MSEDLQKITEELCQQLEKRDELILWLKATNAALEKRVTELETRLNKNSSNSSKPPSADGYRKPKPKSLREKLGRSSGGQKGHIGKTLKQVETPDFVEEHAVTHCSSCECSLTSEPVLDYEIRQVFEIPEPKLDIIEHKAEIKVCPGCGLKNKANFPNGVDAHVQYGPRAKGLMLYFANQQLIPYKRICQLFEDIYGAPLSEGTLKNLNQKAYENLAPFESALKVILSNEPLAHADETGLRVKDKLHWLHSLSTDSLTYYQVHQKRGKIAMNEAGILPEFVGTLVHDFWKSYFTFDCQHAMCNAHLLRELKGIYENKSLHMPWAEEMACF